MSDRLRFPRLPAGARPGLLWLLPLFLVGLAVLWALPSTAAAYDRLRWCMDPLQMPYSQQNAYPPGFDVEIAARIANILDHEQEIYWADTGTVGGMGRAMRQSIQAHKCDAFMSIVSAPQMEEELEEKGLVLTRPYMAVGMVLIVHPNSPTIQKVSDLAGKVTAIQNATYGHRIVIVNDFEYRRFRFPDQLLEAVEQQKVDAGILFGPLAGWTIQSEFEGHKVAISREFHPGPEYTWDIGIAVRKEDEELLADLNRAIGEMRANNEIAPILAKYGVNWIEPKAP